MHNTILGLKVGDLVLVNDEAYGHVAYVTDDGIGVNLIGEGSRVDEWHPLQVELAEMEYN